MDMEIFMKKRQEMKFSLEEVSNLLNKLGYRNCVVETGIMEGVEKRRGNGCFKAFCWKNQKEGKEELKKKLELEGVPEHFAYIKFYSEGSNAKNDKEIWSLVAGESNINNPDLCFEVFATEEINKQKINEMQSPKVRHRKLPGDLSKIWLATVYKGNIIKNLIMDCQSYTKYRPNETTGGIFVSWRRKEELPTGA